MNKFNLQKKNATMIWPYRNRESYTYIREK